MLNPHRLTELTLFDFFYSLRSLKSLVFLIPYFLFWFLVFDNVSSETIDKLQSAQGLFIASWLLDSQDLALQLFVDRSATLSIYLIISISLMPMFVMLAANNQYSSDASRGAFRFILTRTTRLELYIARFLAAAILLFCCLLITTLWATLLAYLHKEDELQTLFLFSSQTFLILFFYSPPFIAFMSMVSAFAQSAFGSLFLGIMLYVFLILLTFWLRTDIHTIIYLIPGWIKPGLYNISLENILTSVVLLSCYTLFYFVCGWKLFLSRDM